MELKKGATLKITLDNAYMEKCDENILWLDYKNICKVVDVGSKIYVDDGLISLLVKQKGRDRSRQQAGSSPLQFFSGSKCPALCWGGWNPWPQLQRQPAIAAAFGV